MKNAYSKTRLLVEGALMAALALVLSFIPFIELPHGGAITLFSMVPILIMSYRNGVKWGCFTAFLNGVIQLGLGIRNLAYCQTITAQIGCVLLDYLLAYTALGLAAAFAKPFKNRCAGYGVSTGAVCLLRFLCSFLSGYIVWYDYDYAFAWMSEFGWGAQLTATLGESALCWAYSFFYNLSYMLPEAILTVAGILLLYKAAPRLFARQ